MCSRFSSKTLQTLKARIVKKLSSYGTIQYIDDNEEKPQ